MKNPRLVLHGALVVALVAPSLSAADATAKKKPFWNRLRQPKSSAPAENPPPPADPANPAAPAAAGTTAAAQPANPAPGANPAATPNAGPAPAATAAAASTAAPAGASAAPPPGTVAPTATAPVGAAPAAAAAAPAGAAPAVAAATSAPAAGTAPADDHAAAAAAAAAAVVVVAGTDKAERVTSGNKDIDRIVARMRTGPLGQEPAVVPYLDLLATGQATPAEMNDFASYIARKGLVEDAVVIQKQALEVDEKNAKLWLNLGLLERGAGRPGPAGKAFQRSVELNPASGPAWYNLGVIQDADSQYDAAIESFRRALTIDPTLGDPKYNPQAINNPRLLVVRLMLAQQTAGTRALSLTPMQEVAQQADTLAPETVPSPEKKTPVESPTAPPPPKK